MASVEPFLGMAEREDRDVELAETLAEVARALLEEKGVDATLERICSTAGRMRGLKALDRVWGQIPLPQLGVGSASP